MDSNEKDEKRFFQIFFTFILVFILSVCVFGLLFLSSCNPYSEFYRCYEVLLTENENDYPE